MTLKNPAITWPSDKSITHYWEASTYESKFNIGVKGLIFIHLFNHFHHMVRNTQQSAAPTQKIFSALRTSVWSKKKWGVRPGSSHGFATELYVLGCAGGQIGQYSLFKMFTTFSYFFQIFFSISFYFIYICPFSRFYHIVLTARFKTLLEIVSQIENGTNFPIIGRHSFSFYF